jgi:hypothetical protein
MRERSASWTNMQGGAVSDVNDDELDLATLGFADAAATGRPGYHPVASRDVV